MAIIRLDALAIASNSIIALAVSIQGIILIVPTGIIKRSSSSNNTRSVDWISHRELTLPKLIPYNCGLTILVRSSFVNPVSKEFTLIITFLLLPVNVVTHSDANSRAVIFSLGGTESSKSTITISVLKFFARSNMLGRLPGTKIKLRKRSK